MRKSRLAAAAALSLLSTAALAETRSLNVAAFDRVDIATGITAIITRGDRPTLRMTADNGNAFDQIEIKVRNGELVAKRRTNLLDIILNGGLLNKFFSRDEVTLEIALPELTELTASSGAVISADLANSPAVSVKASSGAEIALSSATAASISLSASSGADISVSGTCTLVDIDVSSGASVRAGDLLCADAHVEGSSGASAALSATGAVTGSVSSGGSIHLATEPASVNVKSSSGGSLRVL